MFRNKPPGYDPHNVEDGPDGPCYGSQIDEQITLAWDHYQRMLPFIETFDAVHGGPDDEADRRNQIYLESNGRECPELDEIDMGGPDDESQRPGAPYEEESQVLDDAYEEESQFSASKYPSRDGSQALHDTERRRTERMRADVKFTTGTYSPSPLSSKPHLARNPSFRDNRSQHSQSSQASTGSRPLSRSSNFRDSEPSMREPPPSRSPSVEITGSRLVDKHATGSMTLVSSNEKNLRHPLAPNRSMSGHAPSEISSAPSSTTRIAIRKYLDRGLNYEGERHEFEARIQELEKENGELKIKVQVLE